MVEVINIKGENFVLVPQSDYDRAMKELNWLTCLEAAGVDNWEGYDVAVSIRNGEEPY